MVSPSAGRRKAPGSLRPRGQSLSCAGDPGARGPGGQTLTELVEEEGVLVLLHVLRGAGLIQEERVDSLDVVYLHLRALEGDRETSVVPLPREGSGPAHRGHSAWVQARPRPPAGCRPKLSLPQ